MLTTNPSLTIFQMGFDPRIHHRRSVRLKSWDYSWPWWYYVTITANDEVCRFGSIVNDKVRLSPLGKAVQHRWLEIPNHSQNVELDEFVVMPNHLHGIVIIGEQPKECFCRDVPRLTLSRFRGGQELNVPAEKNSDISPKKGSLSTVIRTFKAAVTTWARENAFSDSS